MKSKFILKIISNNLYCFYLTPIPSPVESGVLRTNSSPLHGRGAGGEVFVNYFLKITKLFLFILFISFFYACTEHKKHTISPAFYFWKSNFKLSDSEHKALEINHVKKIYLKVFDISWNQNSHKPQIVAPIRFSEKIPDSTQIVPVVFITNQTFIKLQNAEIESFADSVFEKIKQLSKSPIQEFQIDCDWTLSTKQKYFQFLKAIKQDRILLSATIRLHQVKFFEKTGVPPVDRGMLMCYNMSDWQNPETRNSIYSLKVLNQYIQRLEAYPLPLDVVMPIFHWTVVFRNQRFHYFVNNLSADSLKKNPVFMQMSEIDGFMVKKDTIFNDFSIRTGDVFRCESSPFEEVFEGSEIILDKISNQKLTFALYHLDTETLSFYSDEQISKLLHTH
jgi:hypothetical protein